MASRRDAEKLLGEGRVKVNNAVVTHPATFITPGDLVVVNGTLIDPPDRTRVWRYHKPDGLVTTHKDPQDRPTVFQRLPPELPRVVSVGRLDLNSEGLLLLTNDGALARKLELPANGWIRRYRVRAFGHVEPAALAALAQGVTIDGVRYGEIEAGLDSRKGDNCWMSVGLREGRNREVRRVMAHLGLQVTRLIRVVLRPVPTRQPAARRGGRGAHQGAARTAARRLNAHRRRRVARPRFGRAPRPDHPPHRRPGAPGAVRPAAARALGRPGAVRGRHGAGRLRRHRCAGAGGAVARGGAGGVHGAGPRRPGRAARQYRAPAARRRQASVLAVDATRPPPGQPAALAFLDPPYGQDLGPRAVAALRAAQWLAAGAVVVLETGRAEAMPALGECLANTVHGVARMTIWRI